MAECDTNTVPPNPKYWWKNRRRIAWVSLICAIVETVALLVLALILGTQLSGAGALIGWTYTFWGTNVAAYVAASTWADVASARKQ